METLNRAQQWATTTEYRKRDGRRAFTAIKPRTRPYYDLQSPPPINSPRKALPTNLVVRWFAVPPAPDYHHRADPSDAVLFGLRAVRAAQRVRVAVRPRLPPAAALEAAAAAAVLGRGERGRQPRDARRGIVVPAVGVAVVVCCGWSVALALLLT